MDKDRWGFQVWRERREQKWNGFCLMVIMLKHTKRCVLILQLLFLYNGKCCIKHVAVLMMDESFLYMFFLHVASIFCILQQLFLNVAVVIC